MPRLHILALAGVLLAAGAPPAFADWFGTATMPDHVQLLTEVADSQQIMPGKPFVARVTRLDGKVESSILTPTEIDVVGDAISVAAENQAGNKVMLSLIRRPGRSVDDGPANGS